LEKQIIPEGAHHVRIGCNVEHGVGEGLGADPFVPNVPIIKGKNWLGTVSHLPQVEIILGKGGLMKSMRPRYKQLVGEATQVFYRGLGYR